MLVLGVVPYLNAVPLVARLGPDVDVQVAVPSALSDLLREGAVDAALLPVAEAARGVGDGFLGTYGIAGEGPVESVLLFLRCPLEAVRTVVLDPASRTSVALARHLVEDRRGVHPGDVHYAERPGPDPQREAADAVLVIGDPALDAAAGWTGEVLDLGAAWTEATGLPFVFARWTARTGLAPDVRAGLALRLDAAAEAGCAHRAALARAWAVEHGQDADAAVRYVTRAIRYRLGAREEEGLARFTRIVQQQDAARHAREAPHA